MTVFKNILVASQIEEATLNQLQVWTPTYLREVERQLGIALEQIPRPALYSNRNSFDYEPGERFPKVIAISPGLADTPIADGGGIYRATWRLGIGVALGATTEPVGNMWAKCYAAAIRKIMIDKPSLGGIAVATRWEDEVYEDLAIPDPNMLFKSASVFFSVDCNNVSTKWSGPENPDEDPYAWGRVEHVIIDLEKVAVDAEV